MGSIFHMAVVMDRVWVLWGKLREYMELFMGIKGVYETIYGD